MTPEKVIDILDRIVDAHVDGDYDTDDAIEALKIARKTMLKRNYNKALYIICSKRRSVTGIRYMPMCKSPYIDKDQGDYCPGCGQKMYWDREEKDVKE